MKTPGTFTDKFNGTSTEQTTSIFLGSIPSRLRDGKSPTLLARKGKNDKAAQNLTRDEKPAGLETLLNTETLGLLTEEIPMEDIPEAPMRVPAFNALIQNLQRALLSLGFDLGQHGDDGLNGVWTGHAMREYELFYGAPDRGSSAGDVLSKMENTAAQAKEQGDIFGTASQVIAALRLASRATGVKFGYLMELADYRSGFDPQYREGDRAGLFGWSENDWLDLIERFGARYGLNMYAGQVERKQDDDGETVCRIANPIVQRQVLALRLNPRIAALMAAEEAAENVMRLTVDMENRLSRAEMALAHLFGLEKAQDFLNTMRKKPYTTAEKLFPKLAAEYPKLFYTPSEQPLPMAQVYGEISELFSTGRFDSADTADDTDDTVELIPA